jgi:hemerythrin-like metal-binding protein
MESTDPVLIEWDVKWNVGFARFDAEHVELMRRGNAIILALYAATSAEALRTALDALLDRMVDHFRDEEALMEQTYYPHLADHAGTHNRLAHTLLRFAADCRAGKVSTANARVFLLDWLLEHILQEDVCYADHFTMRGLG